jgi:hypothetical protein
MENSITAPKRVLGVEEIGFGREAAILSKYAKEGERETEIVQCQVMGCVHDNE